jgi:8-oxo-dGTP diphosphatase
MWMGMPGALPCACAEIEEYVWLTYADRERSAPVDRIIFDWLRERGEL